MILIIPWKIIMKYLFIPFPTIKFPSLSLHFFERDLHSKQLSSGFMPSMRSDFLSYFDSKKALPREEKKKDKGW